MTQRSHPDRLAQLQRLVVLDTNPEEDFDRVTAMLSIVMQAPITMVNMLDERRDWFKSCVGLSLTESPAATSFCSEFFRTTDPVIIAKDTTKDARFAAHPFVVGEPFIRFYAGARLEVHGQTVGTLCAYDVKPHEVDAGQLLELQVLASAVAEKLAHRDINGESIVH
jgi:GAF domain-containing protein